MKEFYCMPYIQWKFSCFYSFCSKIFIVFLLYPPDSLYNNVRNVRMFLLWLEFLLMNMLKRFFTHFYLFLFISQIYIVFCFPSGIQYAIPSSKFSSNQLSRREPMIGPTLASMGHAVLKRSQF